MGKDRAPHGTFCWNELMTKDVKAARAFYAELLGWTMREERMGGQPYVFVEAAGRPVAGMMPAEGPASQWISYVSVDRVDEVAARIPKLGGRIFVPPTDVPNVGRFSLFADPTGASVSILQLS